jgi:hypothetical protein
MQLRSDVSASNSTSAATYSKPLCPKLCHVSSAELEIGPPDGAHRSPVRTRHHGSPTNEDGRAAPYPYPPRASSLQIHGNRTRRIHVVLGMIRRATNHGTVLTMTRSCTARRRTGPYCWDGGILGIIELGGQERNTQPRKDNPPVTSFVHTQSSARRTSRGGRVCTIAESRYQDMKSRAFRSAKLI